MLDVDRITGNVIDIAMRVHRDLGPGLLESVYETVLAAKLEQLGHRVFRQYPVTITFEELIFEGAFRADLLVDDCLVVEIKCVERLTGAHQKQLLTYLRLLKQPVGLLINFSGETVKEGLRRVVNNYIPSAPSRLRVNQ